MLDLVNAALHANTEIEPQLLLGPNGGPVWVHDHRIDPDVRR